MPRPPAPTYFTCTLGQATGAPQVESFANINRLLDKQAANIPELPAIGFYRRPDRNDRRKVIAEVLTFAQVLSGVSHAAEALAPVLDGCSRATVGLLSASSPEFFLTWLACIRRGHAVLIIAPECVPVGIASLCRNCDVSVLVTDEKNEDLGRQAVAQLDPDRESKLACSRIPFNEDDVYRFSRSTERTSLPSSDYAGSDIAYFHHTSGTSSGVPKPIAQSHHGAVGALPVLDGRGTATFTTTPLYHGGPADIFRAWTSAAMIWLFPSQHLPITAANVTRCLESARDWASAANRPHVRYFSCVPYILQSMAEDDAGLIWLQSMDLVGVGGAALPQAAGDDMVNRGVRLVSRYGSAECGFLASSHRDYDVDKDWQFLRFGDGSDASLLRFEQREAGLAELIVRPGWPHMAKRNRDDGSYATSDLFEPHARISGAWRYHSRADAQLTLLTGKKFDPAPMEVAIVASTPLLADCLIFGKDRPYPGALLFRSEKAVDLSDEELLRNVASIIENGNAASQAHARIPLAMLVPMPHSNVPLDKSSKGTVLRGRADERYAVQIEEAYMGSSQGDEIFDCPDEQLSEAISKMIMDVTSAETKLDRDQDLFSFGLDSVAGIQIRSRLQRYLPPDAPRLPTNVVENCATVANLSRYITSMRHGKAGDRNVIDSAAEMRRLVERYSSFDENPALKRNGIDGIVSNNGRQQECVILTGATGALGAHVLDQLRRRSNVSKIFCLSRGADENAARARINKVLEQRQLPAIKSSDKPSVFIVPTRLSDRHLGLSDNAYRDLATQGTVIMHLAWSVNFRMQLHNFEKDSIAGVRNLINLALSSANPVSPSFLYCSSVASTMNYGGSSIPEAVIDDPGAASDLGYSQSKWVAEQICRNADQATRLRGRMSIARVGQLSGDIRHGVWNSKEAWPLMLSTVDLLGCLPDLDGEILDWLPVDVGAAAIIQAALQRPGGDAARVYHVVNDAEAPSWRQLLAWIQRRTEFEVVSPQRWVEKLEEAAVTAPKHPALPLLEHWKAAFGDEGRGGGERTARKAFEMVQTKNAIPVLRNVRPIDEAYVGKLWGWIDANMGGEIERPLKRSR